MASLQRSALVPYSPEQMYALVNDVGSYPEFLPWCTGSRILHQEESRLEATITLSKGAINQRFTTMNTMLPGRRIDVHLVEGPFRRLTGAWCFDPLGDSGCKILFDLEFELNKGLLAMAFGKVFSQLANSMVDAFCKRARQVYGV